MNTTVYFNVQIIIVVKSEKNLSKRIFREIHHQKTNPEAFGLKHK